MRAELADRMADAETRRRRPWCASLAGRRDQRCPQPVLTRSSALTDADLIAVANSRGQDHLRAISQRTEVSEALSEVIVERGDDHTLGVLLHNQRARFSRSTQEAVVDRAAANPSLHQAVIGPGEQALPPDLMNEMYFVVED